MTKFTFRQKLLFSLISLVTLSLACSSVVIQVVTNKQANDNFLSEFEQALSAFQHLQALQKNFLDTELTALTQTNAQFRTVLSTASVESFDMGFGKNEPKGTPLEDANLRLQSILPSLALHKESDIFFVTNAFGELLYSKITPQNVGIELGHLDVLTKMEDSNSAYLFWDENSVSADFLQTILMPKDANSIYQVLAKTIRFGSTIHGVVVIGKRLDNDFLSSIKSIAHIDLGLISDNELIASTLDANKIAYINVLLNRDKLFEDNMSIEHSSRIHIDDAEYILHQSPVAKNLPVTKASFIVIKNLSEALAYLDTILMTMIITGVIILVIALSIGFGLVNSFSKPLTELTNAARAVGKGDLETKVDITSKDEFGMLGKAFNKMTDGLKERNFVKNTFERYVSKEIATEILSDPKMLKLGGNQKDITVMFADIGGFTHLSEKLKAEDVMMYLNEFFSTATEVIFEYNGTLNQYQGDAILAFWGAPVTQDNHATLAVQAALKCQDDLKKLISAWEQIGLPPTSFRIGLNTGSAVVGNIGSRQRFSYAAHGDNVNLASRIEGTNKFYHTHLLITQATWEQCQDTIIAREIDTVRVVGKQSAVTLYEPLCTKDNITHEQQTLKKLYAKALHAYRNQQWETAEDNFKLILSEFPDDGPSQVLLKRIETYKQSPPDENWRGIFTLDAK